MKNKWQHQPTQLFLSTKQIIDTSVKKGDNDTTICQVIGH